MFELLAMSLLGAAYVNACLNELKEEEKQKLLKAIDENGYIWDEEKLELRKNLISNNTSLLI